MDVTFERLSLEVFPPAAVLAGTPAGWLVPVLDALGLYGVDNSSRDGASGGGSNVRLVLDSFVPAALMVGSALLYWFVLVPAVFPRLKGSTVLAKLRPAHNFFLCVFSLYCCGATLYFLTAETGQLLDWERLLCQPLEGTWLRAVSTLFTISKLYEWGDTMFLVALGTRPPEFLHLYHHATTFWLFLFVMALPGPEKFGMLLNGFVHFLMYWHYWRPWPKSLVPAITVLQMAQLGFVIYAWSASPGVCPAAPFHAAMRETPLSFVTPYFMVPVYLWFFMVFFYKRFVRGSRASADGKTKRS